MHKAAFYQLRIISELKSILSFKDLEIIIHAFVSSRIDYCNSVYFTGSVISSSVSTMCFCKTFDSNKEERERITPVLVYLHWLPVSFRIELKVLLMVFKALHGIAPKIYC